MSNQRSVNWSAVVIAAAITLLTIATVANNRNVASRETERANSRPYTMQYSNMISAVDFNLGKGETYYSKLSKGQENILLFWGSYCPIAKTCSTTSISPMRNRASNAIYSPSRKTERSMTSNPIKEIFRFFSTQAG